jgi:ADP-ribose pyrophosphatase YjhB (NUDIX family)
MKRFWRGIGTICYWLSWPILYFYLKDSHRTRVIIEANGRVLVVMGWLGRQIWSLPGGGLHANESVKVGAAREVREETGITLTSGQLKSFVSKLAVREVGFRFYVDGLACRLNRTIKPAPQKFEIASASWLPIDELLTKHRIEGPSHRLLQTWLASEHLLD